MNRREFLKLTSGTALALAGTAFVADRILRDAPFTGYKGDERRRAGRLDVSCIGLGCLPMVGYYGGKYDKKEMIALIRRAFDKGVTFFDTAEVYGPYTDEE